MTDPLIGELLRDMRAEAYAALNIVGDREDRAISEDPTLSRALAHALLLLGEAAAQMPKPFRDAHPHMAWDQARALRNRIVHGYRTIVPAILVSTARHDLPSMIADIDRLLRDLPQ